MCAWFGTCARERESRERNRMKRRACACMLCVETVYKRVAQGLVVCAGRIGQILAYFSFKLRLLRAQEELMIERNHTDNISSSQNFSCRCSTNLSKVYFFKPPYDSDSDNSEDESNNYDKPSSLKRHFFTSDDHEEEEDEQPLKRVVHSQQDKIAREYESLISGIEAHIQSNDVGAFETDLAKLNKVLHKSEHKGDAAVPQAYIKALCMMEDYVAEMSVAKLSAANTKDLTRFKNKLKKNNSPFLGQIAKHRMDGEVAKNGAHAKSEPEDPPPSFLPSQLSSASTVTPTKEELIDGEEVDERIGRLLALRGKKGTNKQAQIEQFERLIRFAKTNAQLVSILMHLVSAQFDAGSSSTSSMTANLWRGALLNLRKVMNIIKRTPFIESDDSPETAQIIEGLLVHIKHLSDELTKGFQSIEDPRSLEYENRLQDEQSFLAFLETVHAFYRLTDPKHSALVAFLRMERMYYKGEKDSIEANHSQLIDDLAVIVCAHGDYKARAAATLMQIFHHALFNRFHEANGMMMASNLQEIVQQMDVPTQIFFNRTMVQLGLCAFRCNLISEAHYYLAEICGGPRMRELLAQGTSRFHSKSIEQEIFEKKHRIPAHMHFDFELLECVHLVSAMLLEVPNMAAKPKRKVISRAFHRVLESFELKVFNGPLENNRDFIASAAQELAIGNWQTAETLLLSLAAWELVPNTEDVKGHVRKRIKEAGLRTYLLAYGDAYDSICVRELAHMFAIEKAHALGIASKMIFDEELKAHLDQLSGTLVMHDAGSSLQALALQFATKAEAVVENYERLREHKDRQHPRYANYRNAYDRAVANNNNGRQITTF